MANQVVTENVITVHGRGSVIIPYNVKDNTGSEVDISEWVLFFEVDGIPIREELEPDPGNPLGRMIKLERTQVGTLLTRPLKFAVVDETLAADDIFTVLWEGVISYTGYKGAPDEVSE